MNIKISIMTIKPFLAIPLFSILIALTGCGGSSSSSYNANSQTNVAFANTSKFNYAQVSIVNSEGKETLFIDNINCPSGSNDCYINLNTALNAGDTLLFKNASGVMVGAITAANSSSGYTALSPSSMSTGFYLANRLSSELSTESAITWNNFSQRTLTFFTNYNSPDGSADQYEEVGDYYASQITKTAASERAFLDSFKTRLLNWDVAASNELPGYQTAAAKFLAKFKPLFANNRFTLISQAHAQEAPCNQFLTKFLSFAGAVGKVLPVVGEGVAGAGKLGETYCKGPSKDTKSILSELNDLQNTVNQVSKTISALSKFVFQEAITNKNAEFQRLGESARQLDADYQGFLQRNNSASLEQFFVNEGGWQAGLKKGDVALQRILNSPYTSDGNGMYTRIMEITRGDFDTYRAALSNVCSQITVSSTDNFLLTRQLCNNSILQNSGILVTAQAVSLPIFKDIYATLSKYPEAGNAYLRPADFTSFASASSIAEAKFKDQLVDMISKYATTTRTTVGSDGHGFFDVFAGLDTTLMANLVRRQCNQAEESGRKNYPAIVGWYAPDSRTDGVNNYIETKCKLPSTSIPILARYYSTAQGNIDANDVVNILGVPVAAAYADQTNTLPVPLYYSTQQMASRTNWENLATFNDASLSVYLEAPGARAVGAVGYRVGVPNGVISPNLSASNNLYDLISTATRDNAKFQSLYVLVPSKGDYFRVARLNVEFNHLFTLGSLDCIAAPCRTNPNNKEWIIFTEDGDTLDFRPTTRSLNSRKIVRVAAAGG